MTYYQLISPRQRAEEPSQATWGFWVMEITGHMGNGVNRASMENTTKRRACHADNICCLSTVGFQNLSLVVCSGLPLFFSYRLVSFGKIITWLNIGITQQLNGHRTEGKARIMHVQV